MLKLRRQPEGQGCFGISIIEMHETKSAPILVPQDPLGFDTIKSGTKTGPGVASSAVMIKESCRRAALIDPEL